MEAHHGRDLLASIGSRNGIRNRHALLPPAVDHGRRSSSPSSDAASRRTSSCPARRHRCIPHHSLILAPEEVRTIFISGLPDDVKERELQNMLRWLPGYEASQVNYKGGKPMGFALFSTPPFAVAAKDNLQGLLFECFIQRCQKEPVRQKR